MNKQAKEKEDVNVAHRAELGCVGDTRDGLFHLNVSFGREQEGGVPQWDPV
jgi:hypothetical protein